ncbi:unnamed protein product [Pylaiella littoralis]
MSPTTSPSINVGSRAQVMHGTAKKTSGGLSKHDLVRNKSGSIVSKKKSLAAKRSENGLLELWREAMKEVSSSPTYKNKFVKPKRGSAIHKKVFAVYERLVMDKYATTHRVQKKKIGGYTKIVLG